MALEFERAFQARQRPAQEQYNQTLKTKLERLKLEAEIRALEDERRMNLDNSTGSVDVPGGKDGAVKHRGNFTRPDGTTGSITGTVNEIAQRAFEAGMRWTQEIRPAPRQAQGMTFGEYAQKWLEAQRTMLETSGWGEKQSIHLKHLSQTIGHCDINKITNSDIKTALAQIRKPDGNEYAPSYCKAMAATARQIFSQAWKDGVIERNPLPTGERVKMKCTPPKEKENSRLSDAEVIDVFANVLPGIPASETQTRLYIACALLLGCRRQELAALKWEDIDDIGQDAPFIHITHKVVYGKSNKGEYVSGAKTKSGIRDIAIPELLKPYIADATPAQRTGFVFRGKKCNPDGRTHISEDGFAEIVKKATEYLPETITRRIGKLTAHNGRRTHSDIERRAGVDRFVTAATMGHSMKDMHAVTEDIYMHADSQDKKEAAQKVNDYIRAKVKAKTA